MKNRLIPLGFLILANCLSNSILGQSATVKAEPATAVIANSEPGTLKLEQLFKLADVVAVVRVVSGDTENYKTAIYKAVVVNSFKGTTDGQTLYYGPYEGGKLGWEYVVFLHSVKEPAVPKDAKNPAYGTVKYFEVFNQGYSSMESSYACVFDERTINDQCDFSVRVCTDYVVLPTGTPVFPSMDEHIPFGCRWVRKTKFLSLLSEQMQTEVPKQE